ncbi:MAG TPA: hypothetical protein VFU14_01695 [Acidimicrobiales bacterium]|nr:hypothetical protein [Acidimicrobiales bacterium]
MLHPIQTEMLVRARLEDARRDATVRRPPSGRRSRRQHPGERGGWWPRRRRTGATGADVAVAPAPAPATPAPPIACSLDATELGDRIRRWQDALAAVQARRVVPGGVQLRFEDPGSLREIGPLAAAEHECCPFFDFVISLDGDGLVMEVTAPELAQPLVDAVFGDAAGRDLG